MSLQQDQQHLNAILEAAHAAALEFLKSLPTWPAGRAPHMLPHQPLPDEGRRSQPSAPGTKPGSRPHLARATWAL
jgi:hypothetical protein